MAPKTHFIAEQPIIQTIEQKISYTFRVCIDIITKLQNLYDFTNINTKKRDPALRIAFILLMYAELNSRNFLNLVQFIKRFERSQ